MRLCVTESDYFRKTYFAPNIGKMGQNWAKNSFFYNLFKKKEKVFNVYWICSIMEIYIICCVSVHNLCLVKILFLFFGQNALCQSDCSIFKWTKCPEQINEADWFCAGGYQFKRMKLWSIIFWVGMGQNRCDQSGFKNLKLNVSQEWPIETNLFFKWCWKFRKTKSCFNDFW